MRLPKRLNSPRYVMSGSQITSPLSPDEIFALLNHRFGGRDQRLLTA